MPRDVGADVATEQIAHPGLLAQARGEVVHGRLEHADFAGIVDVHADVGAAAGDLVERNTQAVQRCGDRAGQERGAQCSDHKAEHRQHDQACRVVAAADVRRCHDQQNAEERHAAGKGPGDDQPGQHGHR